LNTPIPNHFFERITGPIVFIGFNFIFNSNTSNLEIFGPILYQVWEAYKSFRVSPAPIVEEVGEVIVAPIWGPAQLPSVIPCVAPIWGPAQLPLVIPYVAPIWGPAQLPPVAILASTAQLSGSLCCAISRPC